MLATDRWPRWNTVGVLHDLATVSFVPSRDLARARAFYEGVLGLVVTHEDGFALVLGHGAGQIRVVAAGDFSSQPFTILGWETADIDAAVGALAKAGVDFVRYEGFDQDAAAIWTAPGGGRVTWFRDPDDNVLSLSSSA